MTDYDAEAVGLAGSDVPEIAALARAGQEPQALDHTTGLVLVVSNADGSSAVVDLRDLGELPPAKFGAPTFYDTESFVTYVNEHSNASTVVYADESKMRVVAVLDDHAAGAPGWGDHRAVLAFQPTREWQEWTRIDGELMAQEEFALFVEDHARSIIDPPAADVFELAQHFEATSGATFRSSRRLGNGQVQLTFDENIEAAAGLNGELVIPETVTVSLEPFEGAGAVEMVTRFRYRLRGAAVKFALVLDRPDLVVKEAIAGELDRIRNDAGLSVLRGVPTDGRSDRGAVRVTDLPKPTR